MVFKSHGNRGSASERMWEVRTPRWEPQGTNTSRMDREKGDRKSGMLSCHVNQGGRMLQEIGSVQESWLLLNSQLRWESESPHCTWPLNGHWWLGRVRGHRGEWGGDEHVETLSMDDCSQKRGIKAEEREDSEEGVWGSMESVWGWENFITNGCFKVNHIFLDSSQNIILFLSRVLNFNLQMDFKKVQ